MLLKLYILDMVGSKQLNSKFKTTRQVTAATPITTATKENNEDLLETIREIVRE